MPVTSERLARYDEKEACIFLANHHQHPEDFDIDEESKIRGDYEIMLSQLESPSEIIHFLNHVKEKTWCTPELFSQFFDEIMSALRKNGYDTFDLPDETKMK